MLCGESSALAPVRLLRFYYAATLLFVALDYFLNINVRIAFLEAWPDMRAAYYLACFGCLGLMIWRPGLSLWIGTIESLLALSLLIVTMGLRVMTVSERILDSGDGLLTMSEVLNVLIVGAAAWFSWARGLAILRGRSGIA